jgi:hypothetical protein
MMTISKKLVVFTLIVTMFTFAPHLAFASHTAEDGDRRAWTDFYLSDGSVFSSGYSYCVSSGCSYDVIGVETTLYENSSYIRDEDERYNTYIAEVHLELMYFSINSYKTESIHWYEENGTTYWLLTSDDTL